MRCRSLPLVVAFALVACADPSRAPTAPNGDRAVAASAAAEVGQPTAAGRWNAFTRAVIGRRESAPLGPARTFALVSVAEYNAVVAAEAAVTHHGHPSVVGAVAGAAAVVLDGIYPAEHDAIVAQLHDEAGQFASVASGHDADFIDGLAIGRAVAVAVLARGATDGSDAVWTGTVPSGDGYWTSAPAPAKPLSPLWGEVRPWFMTSGDEFRPAPPPAFGSHEYLHALAEVRHYSDTRTPEQLRIAQFWQSGYGAGGPAGYFGAIAADLAAKQGLDERQTTRTLAMMDMAVMDASIGCWDAKYAYWYIRPFQADPEITTPVGRPNFPSYPSAHSCLSSAAAGVLAELFPSAADHMRALVAEAGEARIYAGLHYRFDVIAGRHLGYSVAALAVARMPHGAIPLH